MPRAKTSTERSRLFRERHKHTDEYKAKAAQSCKKYREANREKCNKSAAARMRNMRERRKREQEEAAAALANAANLMYIPNQDSPFRTRQSEGKAWKKLVSSLPANRLERQHLLARVSQKEGIQLDLSNDEGSSKDTNKTPIEIKVEEFYHREDISRVQPGRKDVRSVHLDDGTKVKVSKRVMQFTLSEAHAIFLKEYDDMHVSRSKFCRLRPHDVFLSSTADQTVCACVIHENMDSFCKAAELGKPSELLYSFLCSDRTHDCITITCQHCPIKTKGFLNEKLSKQTYQVDKWVKGILEHLTLSKKQFQNEIEDMLVKFGEHIYLKDSQTKALKLDKENLIQGEVLIHGDFAENYGIRHRVEPMEAHWSNVPGVMIFTAVAYYRSETNDMCARSYEIVSDCQTNGTL